MKAAILFLLLFISLPGNAQRITLLTDSLTQETARTWILVEGARFTEIGDNCSYGMELTFTKSNNTVLFNECHEGEWKSHDYEYEMIIENDEHVIDLYAIKKFLFWKKREKLDDRLRIQMVSKDGSLSTELILFRYQSKNVITLSPG